MGSFEVQQRTKDGMFHATSLLNQWNKSIGAKGRKGKRIDDFLNLQNTKDFLDVLSDDINNTDDSRYLKTHQSTRGKNGGTWMHPYLFIDFAMWLNPKFKLKVIKFVYDELIKQRHNAGDNYLILSSAGTKLNGYNYSQVAKALQWIVFNKTGKNLRQKASQEQLEELNKVQSNLAFAIDLGHIRTYNQLINNLRRLWEIKYKSNPISA